MNPESDEKIREAWDREAMARAEALERCDVGGQASGETHVDPTLDGDLAVAALVERLRTPG